MKIIDKNTDFYDYYQNIYPDFTFTFDRRDSYLLTKDIMCNNLYADKYWSWREKKYKLYHKYNYILLQVCNTFWLFNIEITEVDNFDKVKDYKVNLFANWRDFNKPRKLFNLDIIQFTNYHKEPKVEDLVNDIIRNNYKVRRSLNKYMVYVGNTKIEKHIPLLKASGLSTFIDAHIIFLTIEEYFSLEKSSSERREPIGSTNNDKIESHGFDLKTSFRGK